MEGVIKNRIIAILAIIGIIFFLLWLAASSTASKQKANADSKAALSMELEEKNVKLEKEKAGLAEELKNAQAQSAEEKTSHEATKKTLSQEQVAEQALKVELERLTRLKEALEKDLKEALTGQKK